MSDLAKRESRGDVVQLERPFFTPEQEEMIRKSFLNGASASEAAVLLEVAKLRKLNPITKQVHFVKRGGTWTVQVGIDGMRSIAERSGKYAGQDEPVYEDNRDGSIKLCKVAVYRKDWDRPAVGVAYFAEYAQQTQIWKQYPRVMVAKCAEALALRKAFPEDLSGIYEPSEIGVGVEDATPKPTAREAAKAKLAELKPTTEAEIVDSPHNQATGEVQQEEGQQDSPLDDAGPRLERRWGKYEAGTPYSQVDDWALNKMLEQAQKFVAESPPKYLAERKRKLEIVETEIAARKERQQ